MSRRKLRIKKRNHEIRQTFNRIQKAFPKRPLIQICDEIGQAVGLESDTIRHIIYDQSYCQASDAFECKVV